MQSLIQPRKKKGVLESKINALLLNVFKMKNVFLVIGMVSDLFTFVFGYCDSNKPDHSLTTLPDNLFCFRQSSYKVILVSQVFSLY